MKHLTLGRVRTFHIHSPEIEGPRISSSAALARRYVSFNSEDPLGEEDQEIRSGQEADIGKGIALILSRRFLGNENEIASQLQPKQWITSLRRRESSPLLRGLEIIPLIGPVSSHLLNQKERRLSFPAIHLIPLVKTSSTFLIAAQVVKQDWIRWLEACLLLRFKYFWESTQAQREFCSLWNLQFNLAKRAMFLAFASWRPRPPSFFGLVIVFQLTRWIFFFTSEETHKKFQLNLSILLNTLDGKAVHCMV